MPSPFVLEQLAALRRAFGEPVLDEPLSVSKVGESFNGPTIDVRPNHALAAARHARRRETWQVETPDGPPYRKTVSLSDITKTSQHHSMLTIVDARPGFEPVVDSAWRLPQLLPPDASPTQALLEFIEANGLPVTYHGLSSLFIVQAVGPTPSAGLGAPITGPVLLTTTSRREENGDGWQISWAYAIDANKYRASF